eukprot:4383120-Pyramimonas_sp.AAC.2
MSIPPDLGLLTRSRPAAARTASSAVEPSDSRLTAPPEVGLRCSLLDAIRVWLSRTTCAVLCAPPQLEPRL